MTRAFVAVCEAEADFELAASLADRTLCERIDWLEEDMLAGQRTWCGDERAADGADGEIRHWIRWRRVGDLARRYQIRAHGHFSGEPGEPDAVAGRKALLVSRRIVPEGPAAVLLIRDSDGDGRRRIGLHQARDESPHPESVLIGVAHCKREAWVLSGFEPRNDEEAQALDSLRQNLGFDPCCRSERLTAKHDPDNDRLSAKRVVTKLTSDDRDRESVCWRETSLETLHRRGNENGLEKFLDELRIRLVPIVSGRNPESPAAW